MGLVAPETGGQFDPTAASLVGPLADPLEESTPVALAPVRFVDHEVVEPDVRAVVQRRPHLEPCKRANVALAVGSVPECEQSVAVFAAHLVDEPEKLVFPDRAELFHHRIRLAELRLRRYLFDAWVVHTVTTPQLYKSVWTARYPAVDRAHIFIPRPVVRLSAMTDDQPLSETTVESLARQVGLETTPERHEQIRAEIAGGLDGYAALQTAGREWSPTETRTTPAVTRDPGPEDDPHNAFLSLFTLDGSDGPLSDLDVALKDNIAVAGVPMTCGSATFADAVPERDATVATRLLDAGATIVGKTNMDELAYGPTGETSTFGPTENPVAPGRVSGGSSAGSAAAVAAGTVDAALGTDTGGSVRIPSSFCGLVGFKPTWGVVPQDGVVELAYTLDHVGPIARDTRTVARVLDAIASPAEVADDGSFADAVASPPAVDSLVLGVPAAFYGDYVTDAVEQTVRERIDALEAAGATIRDISAPLAERAVDIWNAVTNVEFATFLGSGATPLFRRGPVDAAWHRDAAAGMADPSRQFGDVVQRKAVEGAYLCREHDGEHYLAARNGRRVLARRFADALADCDALVTPTMPTEPVESGSWAPHSYSSGGDAPPPLAVNTRPANLAGVPALTLPASDEDTLPIGIQFLGGPSDDATLLAVGAAFEAVRDDA